MKLWMTSKMEEVRKISERDRKDAAEMITTWKELMVSDRE